MLAKKVVVEIDRLVKEGKLTHRRIAAQLGVGRSTVNEIARGRRRLFGYAAGEEAGDCEELEPAERCQTCGFLVHLPCLVCRTREYREQQKQWQKVGHPLAGKRRRRRRRSSGDGSPGGGPKRCRVA
jgi:hypothetical protein